MLETDRQPCRAIKNLLKQKAKHSGSQILIIVEIRVCDE
jgi:hypothetical protein